MGTSNYSDEFKRDAVHQITVRGYLSGVLTAIAEGHKQTDINELLPWNFVRPV